MTTYPQPSYTSNIGVAYVGMPANQEGPEAISRICEDVAGIGFGIALWQGVNDNGVTATPGATSNKFRGVSIRNVSLEPTANDTYLQGGSIGCMIEDVIWVIAGANIAAGDPAYCNATTGAFTNSSAAGAIAIPRGAIFDSTAATGALVKLRLS
jgi:hypothetical protein